MAGKFGFRLLYGDQPLQLYFYAVPHLCLNLMGCWPGMLDALQLRALINFVVLGVGVVTELHAGLQFARNGEVTLALETFCPAATSAVTLLKMFLMLRYRNDLFNVLAHLQQMLFDVASQSDEKQMIMRKHFVMASRFNFWPLSAGFFTATMYNLKPLIFALLQYWAQAEQIEWDMPFNMTLTWYTLFLIWSPLSMPAFLLRAPFYPATYIFIGYTSYVTIFMFGGCDAFYFEFCVHIATLCNFLKADIDAVFRPYDGLQPMDDLRGTLFAGSLVRLIERHNDIFELTLFFRERYWIITSAHFLSASMTIAFSIFNLMTVDDNGVGTLLYIGYTVAALSQLFIYCYGGTLVAESSVHLAVAMSSCPWHICQPRHRLYVMLFIMRSQRALTMAVPFFSPSLPAFAAILQTSGSIITLAKSF